MPALYVPDTSGDAPFRPDRAAPAWPQSPAAASVARTASGRQITVGGSLGLRLGPLFLNASPLASYKASENWLLGGV